jgi:hypothetical protein
VKKRCSRSKACGAGCISNSKACRLNFPTTVNNILNKASDQVGVVELYRAAAAGGKRGGAAQFEKIKKELRQELGRNIRAGEDARELKRRLVAAGVIPARGAAAPKTEENAGQIFQKAVAQPQSVPSALKQELNQIAARDQQQKDNKPDSLYGAWDTNLLVRFRKDLSNPKVEDREIIKLAKNRVDRELARREEKPSEKPPVVLAARQLDKSPGARTRTILPPKRSIADEDLMDDISRIMRGESPQKISMIDDNSARVKIKSQIGQLQSVLGLGAQTRKEVGRDLEGLLEEARNLEGRLMSQQKGFKGSNQERLALLDRLKKVREAIQGPVTKATGNVRYAREDARDHDGDMLSKGISRELGNKSYRWEDSYGSGSTLLGRGAFGTVLREPNKGNAIKRGEVGKIEADLIDRLGKVDLGPKLLAAQLDGDSQYNPGTKIGRVAMSVVAGSPIGSKAPDKEIGGVKVADAYWTARANLHRMGIAHNDMHIDNVLVDRKGKARFVDMGLAQDSPKAALAEAMGVFLPPKGAIADRGRGAAGQGDWQVRRWDGTGAKLLESYEHRLKMGAPPGAVKLARGEFEKKAPILTRIQENKASVQFAMKKDGFTNDDIATVMDHGIRSPMETYEQGVWAKISNEQAQKYISILYDGV